MHVVELVNKYLHIYNWGKLNVTNSSTVLEMLAQRRTYILACTGIRNKGVFI